MAKQINRLTDITLRAYVARREPVAKSDGDGLTFTLSAAGTAAWVLRYRTHGKRRREVTLGNYPDISLSRARELAREMRAHVDRGGDPAVEKQLTKMRARAEWTLRELITDYRTKILTPTHYAADTIKYRTYDIKMILHRLGSRAVTSIQPMDIVAFIDDAEKTWTLSKRLLTTLTKIFDHACGMRIMHSNPCAGIRLSAIKGHRPQVRKRIMLSEDELRTLLFDIDEIGRENALAFRILLATCVRGVELCKAKKSDVDVENGRWWVPDESVKTRRGFLVPLAEPVRGWFRELILLSGNSEYVLPARQQRRREREGGDTHVGRTTLWAAFARAFKRGDIDIRRFTPHDTRSTAKGHMRNLGVSREISEVALNHVLPGLEGIYDVREEIPERREALETWAQFLVSCERWHRDILLNTKTSYVTA